jgi:hypothetical protein
VFRLDSDTSSAALASIAGAQTILSFGAVPTNVPLLVTGRVGPPEGLHTLRLRGSLGGPQTVLDTCSFLVIGGAFSTPTPKPTRTGTPTRTFTPVPGVCVGACTNPGMVTVNDLLTVIQIAAGQVTLSACPSADPNGDDQVSLEEVLQAVKYCEACTAQRARRRGRRSAGLQTRSARRARRSAIRRISWLAWCRVAIQGATLGANDIAARARGGALRAPGGSGDPRSA